jgi:hypothetical protein
LSATPPLSAPTLSVVSPSSGSDGSASRVEVDEEAGEAPGGRVAEVRVGGVGGAPLGAEHEAQGPLGA